MRTLLWFVALFGIAVAIALFAGNNQGTVTVFWPPYRLDLSLNLVLLLLIGLFFTLYVALRALSVLLSLPGEARRWRMLQRERALQLGLLDALAQLLAGRFIRARKSAENLLIQEKALARSDDPLPYGANLRIMAHLLAAESAHALRDNRGRDAHARMVLDQTPSRNEQILHEGVQLRATRWALGDRNVQAAFGLLNALPKGLARRTLALRLRFKAERLAGHTQDALETARLLAKHRAFSPMAAQSILQGLARERVQGARDPAQLQKAWAQLEVSEQLTPEVATQAADQMLLLGGGVTLAQQWLLPVWEQMLQSPNATLSPEQQTQLVRVLDRSFALTLGGPDADWLARIETAQLSQPSNALLQYLAGFACLRLSLWGKAQKLLSQSLTQLDNDQLKRQVWVALAQLAQQREDAQAEIDAWRQAAKIP
jgi:HemY protein